MSAPFLIATIALLSAADITAGASSAAEAPGAPAKPSFDCARASTFAERAVCTDPALARQDAEMAVLYQRALSAVPDPSALRNAQRKALAARAACTDAFCVSDWYAVQRADLGRATVWRLKPGQCLETRVDRVETRLQGVPGSGSAIGYANALWQISYDTIPGIDGSKPGDRVRLCVVSRPKACPAGDLRGSTYAARNLRTGATWKVADAEHMCGGA